MEEIEEDIKIRTSREVAERVLGLIASIGKVHFPEENTKWIENNNIEQYLSTLESEFINTPSPDHQDLVKFSWRAEALVSLLWCLKGLDEMPAFDEQFYIWENELVIKAVSSTNEFLNCSELRDREAIDNMESFLYHQHWRVRDRDFGFNNDRPDEDDPDINELDTGIVYERRYGMSWVSGFGESWDDVPTDT
ncbi:DUF4272 domain-containing protein [Grimontia kaedaensis]|uniref:DUF4272 domain-containing protein n=1 Tax=Grimontia kaedaensis TaxID=2872157 RepID=A0ABY4X1M3_9GAMM|nr:DUF4272 domain-containing protein [Grimontia kaedaensis]USH05162.1 DUF4272 domain-containing protein [Grimontia kaedaensis]